MEDWDKVTVLRKKTPKAAQMRSESAVNQAIRTGQAVETQQKCEYYTSFACVLLLTYLLNYRKVIRLGKMKPVDFLLIGLQFNQF